MGESWLKMNISGESVSAIFIIVLVSLFILSNFAVGFILPLFILVMVPAFFIAVFYPRSGIYAIIFLTIIFERFFTLQTILIGKGEYKLYPIDIILGAVIIGTIFEIISGQRGPTSLTQNGQKRSNLFKFKKADGYLIGFIFFVTIYFFVTTFIFKSDFSLAFSSFKNYVFYSLLYFLVLFLENEEEYIKRLFNFFLAGAIAIIAFIIYGLAARHGLWSDFTHLSTDGIRTLAFTHAFYLSMGFLTLLTYYIVQEKKYISGTGLVLLIIWSIGIIGSMMRHLWAGLGISVFILYFLLSEKQRTYFGKMFFNYLSILMLVGVLIFYLSAIFPYSGFSRATDSTQTVIEKRVGSVFAASQDESFSWRNMVWNEGMKEYLQKPVFGLGLGQRIYVESEGYRDFVEVRNIHNSLLVLLFQFGLIPFILFALFVFNNARNICLKKAKDWIDISLIILLTNYLVLFIFQPYLETNMLGIFFWIILGLIAVRSRKVELAIIPKVQL
ncbi:MAG TPA: O-antigen ligase family protein [Patescibacteria group bacterium]